MAKKSLLETALTDEARRTVLREAEDRFLNELADDVPRDAAYPYRGVCERVSA